MQINLIKNKIFKKVFKPHSLVLKILNKELFKNTLSLNQSKRIKYVPGERNMQELLVNDNINLLQVFLPSISFDQIKAYSLNRKCLPPKSTWILPKIPTGMCIYSM